MPDQHVYQAEPAEAYPYNEVCKHCGGQPDDGKRHLGNITAFSRKIIWDAASELATKNDTPNKAKYWLDDAQAVACTTVHTLLEEFEQRRDAWSQMHPNKDSPRTMAVLAGLYSTCDFLQDLVDEMEAFRGERP
jgi:hypothetical protein